MFMCKTEPLCQSVKPCFVREVPLCRSAGVDTGWQNRCAGDDYASAGAGGNRPLLFVIVSPFPSCHCERALSAMSAGCTATYVG
jgi:hypothetical protein